MASHLYPTESFVHLLNNLGVVTTVPLLAIKQHTSCRRADLQHIQWFIDLTAKADIIYFATVYLAFKTMKDPSPSPTAKWLPSALKPKERAF